MRRLAAALAGALAALLVLPPGALACAGGWTVDGIQRDLMCPTCNQRLDQSESNVAVRMRQVLAERCRAGWSEGRVKDAFVAQFGEEVLAAPRRDGFGLLAWVMPALVLAAGLAVAVGLALAWSRRRPPPPPPPPSPELAARIDRDLDESLR